MSYVQLFTLRTRKTVFEAFGSAWFWTQTLIHLSGSQGRDRTLVVKYLVILAHDIILLFEVDFCFPFQSDLLIDEVDPFLPFLDPFYLCLLKPLYCRVVPFSFSSNVILGQPQKNKWELLVKGSVGYGSSNQHHDTGHFRCVLVKIFCLMRFSLVISDAAKMVTNFLMSSRSNF